MKTNLDDGVRESLSPEIMPSATLVNNGARFDQNDKIKLGMDYAISIEYSHILKVDRKH